MAVLLPINGGLGVYLIVELRQRVCLLIGESKYHIELFITA